VSGVAEAEGLAPFSNPSWQAAVQKPQKSMEARRQAPHHLAGGSERPAQGL
jgi:hypothetical protein